MDLGKRLPAPLFRSPASELIADSLHDGQRRRRLQLSSILVFLPLLGVLCGLAVASLEPPLYESQAILQVVLPGAPRASQRLGKAGMRDETVLLSSDSFRRRVLESLSPELLVRIRGKKHLPSSQAQALPQAGALSKLKAGVLGETSLITLSYRSPDPQLTADIVNAAVPVAARTNLELTLQRVAKVQGFVADKLQLLALRIAAEQQEEDRLSSSSGTEAVVQRRLAGDPRLLRGLAARRRRRKRSRGLDTSGASVIEVENDDADPILPVLERAAVSAGAAERLARARLDLFSRLDALDLAGDLGGDLAGIDAGQQKTPETATFAGLERRLDEATANYAALAATLGDRQPSLVAAAAQIQEIRSQLGAFQRKALETRREEYRLASKNRKAVDSALKEREQEDYLQAAGELSHAILDVELGVDLTVYENMHDRLQSRSTSVGLESPTLEVVDLAEPAEKPLRKSYLPSVELYGVIALALALVIALVLFFRQRTLWTVEQVEDAASMNALAILPAFSDADPPREMAGASSSHDLKANQYSSAIADLHDHLRQLEQFLPLRLLAFTSASPGEGKSSAAAALAVSLAQSGARVLLIDADLASPSLDRRFNLHATCGLSEVLTGQATLAEAIRPAVQVSGLLLLASGAIPPQPSALVQSAPMQTLLQSCVRQFDYVLVDSRPLLTGSDGAFFAGQADLTLLIARYGMVDLGLVRKAAESLPTNASSVLGLLVDGAPMPR